VAGNFSVSQDPGNYDDAPTEGIRRVLEIVTGEKIPRGTVLQTDKIGDHLPWPHLTRSLSILSFGRLHPFVYNGRYQRPARAQRTQTCAPYYEGFQGSTSDWQPVATQDL
jgi:hypothetical protein